MLRDLDGMQLASHSGGDPGAASVVCVDTASKTAVLAFSNISADREFRSFQKEVVQRLRRAPTRRSRSKSAWRHCVGGRTVATIP